MWLAEPISVPDYSGIIFRRTFKQLENSNESLVAKSWRLYEPLGGLYNSTKHTWRFPSGATIDLGALEHETSIRNYTGPSYHRMAFDELTQFTFGQYDFLTSTRIRGRRDFPFTLGVRSSSNPGDIGHVWVMNRFITDEAMDAISALGSFEITPQGTIYNKEGRLFVPSRIVDNQWLDVEAYMKELAAITDPVMRGRVMNGDWRVSAQGLIKPTWLRNFQMNGRIIQLLKTGEQKPFAHFDERDCRRFATIDTAGTSEDRAKERKGKSPSWSVMGIWDRPPAQFGDKLILRHVWRARVDYTDLIKGIVDTYGEWKPQRVIIENKHFGGAVHSQLKNKMPITTVEPGQKDKVTRATDLLNMLERGDVYLPKYDAGWRPALEAEWLSWQGLDEDTNDQIDMAAYAAMDARKGAGRVIKLATDPRLPLGVG